MPALTLRSLYLHDAGDLDSFIVLRLHGEVVELSTSGDVRTMASGRRRAVFGPGSATSFAVTCDFVEPADRQTLEGWMTAHTPLLFREPRGRVAWGHAFRQSQTEKPGNATPEALITFTFETITFDEEV